MSEGPDGVTRIYRASTNELVCCVKEKNGTSGRAVLAARSPNVTSPIQQQRCRASSPGLPCSQDTPTKSDVDRPDHSCFIIRTQASFLHQLELKPALPKPWAVLERLPATCDQGVWMGAQASIECYNKYCATRARLIGPLPGLFPIVHRYLRHQKNLSHVYTFNRAQRLARKLTLATGLSPRALQLRKRCVRVTVDVCRLTPAEVALWTRGRLRLNRTPLRELPSFTRPLACMVSNLADGDCEWRSPYKLKPTWKGSAVLPTARLSLF